MNSVGVSGLCTTCIATKMKWSQSKNVQDTHLHVTNWDHSIYVREKRHQGGITYILLLSSANLILGFIPFTIASSRIMWRHNYYKSSVLFRRSKTFFVENNTPLGVMLKASQAIVFDEYFGPKAEESLNMPALQATNL